MPCNSCSSGLQAYVPSSPASTIKTTGRVIGSSSLGHFGKYVPATERSYITTPGPVESVPNATGGMHVGIHSRLTDSGLSGFMEDTFGPLQKNWISGVANEYVAAGVALVILLAVMK